MLEQNSFAGVIRNRARRFTNLNKIRFIGQGPGYIQLTATWTQTNPASGQLQVAGVNRVIDLQMMGTYTSANFGLQSDGQHGTTVDFRSVIPSPLHGLTEPTEHPAFRSLVALSPKH